MNAKEAPLVEREIPGWSAGQAKMFHRRVRARVGEAWEWLVPDVRRALLAEEVLSVVIGQDREVVHVAAVQRLLHALYEEEGLL